jgi:hypothetical protein
MKLIKPFSAFVYSVTGNYKESQTLQAIQRSKNSIKKILTKELILILGVK